MRYRQSYQMNMMTLTKVLICSFVLLVFCLSFSETNASITSDQKLIESFELMIDTTCNLDLEKVQINWSSYQLPPGEVLPVDVCTWSRVTLINPEEQQQNRYLYFMNGWWSLDCYMLNNSAVWSKTEIGIGHGQEVLEVAVPAKDTMVIYLEYILPNKAAAPIPRILEMTPDEYASEKTKDAYKFLFLGFICFPILFFLAQYLIERDRLNFYYLIFLVGASMNLVTILESTPFFKLTPKILAPLFPSQILFWMFVISVFITLVGLTKYVQHLLHVRSWNTKFYRIGNGLMWLFMIVSIIPLLFPQIFQYEYYPHYLPYLRICAFLIILYILITCAWAVFLRVQYGVTLLVAFAPFVISALYYALSFIFLGDYSKNQLETVVLIIGFFLSLLLFGLILGIRNKRVKSEKLALEHKTEQLEELDKFKSRFYTNFTHEFRTPLTVISGVVQQIKNHDKEKDLISRNCKRLLNSVNQLLDLSRLKNNNLKVDLVHGNIINFMEYLTESFLSLANQKNINLAFFSTAEELMMDYDETKMQQILQNLISNAIKFTPSFGVVKVFADKIEKGSMEYLKIVIKDTGTGIAAEHISHIYDRFYQVDSSDTRQAEGSGIGLALVKELVTLLEGSIDVKSKPNKGTEFIIMLPIKKQPGTQKKVSPREYIEETESEKDDTFELPNEETNNLPIVLIIEDNADVREYMISCIDKNYRTYCATGGKKGLHKALEIIPDVVISDVMMPEMDGFTLCKELKNSPPTSHIPIILITAKATQADKVMGLEHGADAYLTKPFDKEELLARLKNMVNLSRRLKENLNNHNDTSQYDDFRHQREAAFLQKVKSLVESNMYDDHFGTANLCRETAMSRTQLHRKLKALTGKSTAVYIKRIRLAKAKNLIEHTDQAIGEISVQVGFKDFSHFTRSFTKEFGHSPSAVRK